MEPNIALLTAGAGVKLVVEDPNSPYFGIGKPVPYAETGNALLEVDSLPGKSKNGHWYISQHLIASVLEPILGDPILTSGPTTAYLPPTWIEKGRPNRDRSSYPGDNRRRSEKLRQFFRMETLDSKCGSRFLLIQHD
jgi:hypothetical protein